VRKSDDYYVFTSRRGEKYPGRWSWEIRRKSKPLGVKLTGDGYQSEAAAQLAGRRALTETSSWTSERGTAAFLAKAASQRSRERIP
jgi:hypothetical protein